MPIRKPSRECKSIRVLVDEQLKKVAGSDGEGEPDTPLKPHH